MKRILDEKIKRRDFVKAASIGMLGAADEEGKMRKVFIATLAIVLVGALILGVCNEPAQAQRLITMRFACGQPATDPTVVVMKSLQEIISKETNGRVKLEVYPGGQLYGNYDAPKQLQGGALEICLGGCFLAPISPGWSAIGGLPFICEDYEHILRFTKTDAFKTVCANLEAKGLKHITMYGTPGFAQIFNRKKKVEKLEDFKGLKIRIPPAPAMLLMAQKMGIQTVSIAPEEVGSSLQTGMIDGALDPLMNLKAHALLETCPYLTKCNLLAIPVDLVVSKAWWNSLPPDTQKKLERILEEAGEKIVPLFNKQEAGYYAQFQSVPRNIITEIKGAEKTRWLEFTRPTWEKLAAGSEEARMAIAAMDSTRK